MKTKFFVLIALGVATTPARRLPSTLIQWVPVPSGTIVTAATPLTVNGAGYGDVKFEVANADSLIVAANHQNGSGTNMNSLELDAGEIVWVTFLGPQALNVSFDIIGINNGESAPPYTLDLAVIFINLRPSVETESALQLSPGMRFPRQAAAF